jgi:hypothetical protein
MHMIEEERNLEAVRRWAELYNRDVAQMVDESYADDFEVDVRGHFIMHRRETFRRAEAAVVAAAPRRRARIERMIAAGDTVVVEAVLVDPDRARTGSLRGAPCSACATGRSSATTPISTPRAGRVSANPPAVDGEAADLEDRLAGARWRVARSG